MSGSTSRARAACAGLRAFIVDPSILTICSAKIVIFQNYKRCQVILIALAMILLKHGECALSLRDGKVCDLRACSFPFLLWHHRPKIARTSILNSQGGPSQARKILPLTKTDGEQHRQCRSEEVSGASVSAYADVPFACEPYDRSVLHTKPKRW